MSKDLALYSATQLLEGYRRRDFTPMEATEACLSRIEGMDGDLNAFVFVDQEGARKAARESTLRWQTGKPQGRVDGVPTTIKDILLWKGHPTLRGSKSVDPKGPWDQDAPAVARLKEEGAVFLGKTTTPEFGWKGVTDSPLTGITRNPWDKDKTPGGSSGGASAAAAAGFGALHLGTDGGGSIRIPAGFTGIFGLKPTFGRVPAWPLSPYGTVAHVGPMTRTVADAALLLSVIQRFDARDVYALPPDDTDYLAKILKLREARPLEGKRLAFTTKLGGHDTPEAIAKPIREAAERFAELGAVVEEKEPALPDLLPVFTILWFAGAGQVLKTIAEEDHKKLDPGFLEVAEAGQKIQLADYLAAVKAREAAGQVMAAFHETYDALLLPTLPVLAFKAGQESPAGMDRWTSWTPFTYPFNLTQQPAAAVPCGLVEGLPVSLQLVAPRHRDDRALQLSAAYEMLVGGFALPQLT